MSTRRFQRFFDLAKVEKLDDGSGAVRVTGILSSETPDEAGEIITADAMREAIPDYMKFGAVREMHDEIAAGVMLKVEVGDDGKTYCEADVLDESTIKKLLHDPPVLKGWSVGGKKTARDPNNKKRITGIRLTEASLVDRPCNHDALVELAKFATNEEEDDMDEDATKSEADEPLSKGGTMLPETGNPTTAPKDAAATSATTPEVPSSPETLDSLLRKYAGEEIWDAKNALEALSTIFFLFTKEKGEPGEGTGQADALKVALDKLKEFIVSEIMEDSTLAMASRTDDLAKKGAKFAKATKTKLAEAHEHLDKASACMKASGYMDDKDDDDDEAKKAAHAEDLQKLAQIETELEELRKSSATVKAENEELKKTSDQAAEMLGQLLEKRKGALRAVPKEGDTGINADAEDDLTKRAPESMEEATEQARMLISRSIKSNH